jgi:hypothetical protein
MGRAAGDGAAGGQYRSAARGDAAGEVRLDGHSRDPAVLARVAEVFAEHFPAFRFRTIQLAAGLRLVAERKAFAPTGLHTLITGDPDEMQAELAADHASRGTRLPARFPEAWS